MDMGGLPDDFVHAVEDERVPPHDNGDGVVPHTEAVSGDEKALRVGKDVDGHDHKDVDKVAQIGQEVVVALLVVGDEADGHKVEQLGSIPVGEPVWMAADQVTRDEDVHDSCDEGGLFARRHCQGFLPASVQPVYGMAHALLVFVELLCFRRYSAAPLLNYTVPGYAPVLCLVLELLRLRGDGVLDLLDTLREGEVLDEVEHGELLDRREEGGILKVGLILVGAVGEGGGAREARRGKRWRAISRRSSCLIE